MTLHLLPTRTAGAAENMAVDFLLLQRYPAATFPRFRHYQWSRPAFTFGYSQKIDDVRNMISGSGPNEAHGALLPGEYDLCRRPTGGGLVDHRDDWTYALVVPRGHALEADRAAESYRKVHACLVEALRAQNVAARLQPALEADAPGPGVCFRRAEVNDVVLAASGAKIAGAAQKRNKRGLLLQGSIARLAAGAGVDWGRFGVDFAAGLAAMLGTAAVRTPWPELSEEEVGGLTENYASPEWMAHR